MITSSILFIFVGSFFLYNASEKVAANDGLRIQKRMRSKPKISKVLGLVSYILALIMAIISFGTTSGILFWLLSLVLILGLTVIMSPLKKGLYKPVSVLLFTLLIFELFF
ncbi:hypothetical protein [Flavivirga sp. 57AJ16]|uniref:hypothetical protein n=1 Tax=Flavivirga sp. 57AJ16 TaxID=3025307 RepID=UPI002366F0D3|nr:hypothetical protein [Flavivirga sp. 57AJ16]